MNHVEGWVAALVCGWRNKKMALLTNIAAPACRRKKKPEEKKREKEKEKEREWGTEWREANPSYLMPRTPLPMLTWLIAGICPRGAVSCCLIFLMSPAPHSLLV